VPLGTVKETDNIQRTFDLMLETNRDTTITGGRTRQDVSRRLYQKYRRSLDREQIIAAVDFLVEWSRISATPEEAFTLIAALLPQADAIAEELAEEWKFLISLLEQYDVTADQLVIQPALARSWDYYSGIIFELATPNGVHLGGGGRYDELSKLLGGQQRVPAVGFAYYVDNIISLLQRPAHSKRQCIKLRTNPSAQLGAIRWASRLRQRELDVEVETGTTEEEGTNDLYVQDNASVRFQGRIYHIPDIDTLVMELKQNP
jgi:histidyl-tRNA synthetase